MKPIFMINPDWYSYIGKIKSDDMQIKAHLYLRIIIKKLNSYIKPSLFSFLKRKPNFVIGYNEDLEYVYMDIICKHKRFGAIFSSDYYNSGVYCIYDDKNKSGSLMSSFNNVNFEEELDKFLEEKW